MKKTTAVAAFFVVLFVATAATWFFFNQHTLNQINKIQITAFSIDSKGWENLGGLLLNCSFNITIRNMGINDLKEVKLSVAMFVNGSEIDVEDNIFGSDEGWITVSLSSGEIRTFQGELQYTLHQGGAIDTIGGHPLGASYVAQVMLGSTDVLDEAKVTGLFSFELTATILLERHGGYYGAAYDSGKGEIYLTNGDFHLVYVISDRTNTVVATIPVGITPSGIAYDHATGRLFVTNFGSDSVSVISDSNYDVVASIPVGRQPMGIAYDSGTGEIFVANYGSDTVTVISASDYEVVSTVPVGHQPCALAYDSVSGHIFVANYNSNSISVISDNNNIVIATIPLESQPQAICYDSSKRAIFVAYSESRRVSVISVTSTHSTVKMVSIQ
jgi:YVTN family beta-propeller protein